MFITHQNDSELGIIAYQTNSKQGVEHLNTYAVFLLQSLVKNNMTFADFNTIFIHYASVKEENSARSKEKTPDFEAPITPLGAEYPGVAPDRHSFGTSAGDLRCGYLTMAKPWIAMVMPCPWNLVINDINDDVVI